MSEDYARDLYLERGARGVEETPDDRIAAAINAGTIRVPEFDGVRHLAAAIARTEAACTPAVTEMAALEAPALLRAALAWRAVDRAEIFTDEWWDATQALRDVVDRIEVAR